MFDYDKLDPGIRATVRRIHSWGFSTTDSGDGVTKPAAGDEDALDEPHIHILVDPERGIAEAARLRMCLSMHSLSTVGHIQFTYSPDDGIGILSLYGIDDRTWE